MPYLGGRLRNDYLQPLPGEYFKGKLYPGLMLTPISMLELKEYERAANAFDNYHVDAIRECVTYRQDRVAALEAHEREVYAAVMLPHLEKVAECIDLNAEFLGYLGEFGHRFAAESGAPPDLKDSLECVPLDNGGHASKVYSTLRQVAREWSALGQKERDESFGLICAELNARFPDPAQRPQIKVFVPGSGLGRLPFDIAMMGFHCTGNEYNVFMTFTGYFILNYLRQANSLEIAPFVHNFSGHRCTADQLQRVSFPDTSPVELLKASGNFRQAMGDFFESVQNTDHEAQDVMATCFFLDAIPNVLRGIRAISKKVKIGGLWINFGPLLWHYEHVRGQDPRDDRRGGLELDLHSVYRLIESNGWVIEKHSTHKTSYCQNPAEMLTNQYTCEFFVAKRVN